MKILPLALFIPFLFFSGCAVEPKHHSEVRLWTSLSKEIEEVYLECSNGWSYKKGDEAPDYTELVPLSSDLENRHYQVVLSDGRTLAFSIPSDTPYSHVYYHFYLYEEDPTYNSENLIFSRAEKAVCIPMGDGYDPMLWINSEDSLAEDYSVIREGVRIGDFSWKETKTNYLGSSATVSYYAEGFDLGFIYDADCIAAHMGVEQTSSEITAAFLEKWNNGSISPAGCPAYDVSRRVLESLEMVQ